MSEPLVSILVPAFNAAATLGPAWHSLRRQTLDDWECVLVDDGSTDGTSEWIAGMSAVDPRLVPLRVKHGGIVAALNGGLAHCRGRYVARFDADDLMHRDRLAAQVAALEANRGWCATGAHVRVFPRRGLGIGWRQYERWLNRIDSPQRLRAEALVESPLVHPTLMIRREVLARFGYRPCDWPEDYDLLLRLLAEGHDVGMVTQRLLSWRDTPERLTRTDPRCAIERIVACKAHFLAEGFLSGSERYGLWGYGHTGRALRRALRPHGKEIAYVVDVHSGRVGNRIDGVEVIGPDALSAERKEKLVVSVAKEKPRAEIRAFLERLGMGELRDFVCAA